MQKQQKPPAKIHRKVMREKQAEEVCVEDPTGKRLESQNHHGVGSRRVPIFTLGPKAKESAKLWSS